MVYKWNADRIKGREVHDAVPSDGNVLKWNESEQRWEPSSTTVDNDTAQWNADRLQGTSISTDSPNSGDVLSFDGTEWVPSAVTPDSHSTQHESGGSDEINVDDLSGELADPQKPKVHTFSYDNRDDLRSAETDDEGLAIIDTLGLFQFVLGSDEPDDDETSFNDSGGTGSWLLKAPHWDFVYKYFGTEIDEGAHGAGELATDLRRGSISRSQLGFLLDTEEGIDLFYRAIHLYGPSLLLKIPDAIVSNEEAMRIVVEDEIAMRSMIRQPLPQSFSNATMSFGDSPEILFYILRNAEENTSNGVDIVMDLTHYTTLKVYARADTLGDTTARMEAQIRIGDSPILSISGDENTLEVRDADVTDFYGNQVLRFGYDSTAFGTDSAYEAEFGRFWLE